MPMYRGLPSASPSNLPIANKASQEVLCLPIYPGLSQDDQRRIVELIKGR
jgi:dTDP-4-amino-4,6-dideoxygalactose transaminase